MATFAHRILDAKELLTNYMDKVIPVVPASINSSRERHLLTCDQRQLRTWVEEFVTQIDEIKAARTAYHSYLSRLNDASRVEEKAEYEALIKYEEIQKFIKQAGTKLNLIRTAKDGIDRLLDNAGGSGGGGRRFVSLPALSLKSFDGSPGMWDEFWPLFKTIIDDDTEMNEVQKMSYLDAQLRGEAKKCILGLFPFSEDNYRLAKDLLIDKYGKNENLIRDLHNQLSRLPKSDKLSDDLKLQVEVERICRQLEHYKQDLKSPQIYLNLEQKMSRKVLAKYVELKTAKLASMPEGSEWTTTLFRTAYAIAVDHLKQIRDIETRCGQVTTTESKRKSRERTKEKLSEEEPLSSTMNMAIQYALNSNPATGSNRTPLGQRAERQSPARNRSESRDSSTSNHSSSSRREGRKMDKRNDSPHPDARGRAKARSGKSPSTSRSRSPARNPCRLCDGLGHFEMDCPKFRNSEQRRKAAMDKKLCYVCLNPGHFASDCSRYKLKCILCRTIKHHPALCPKRYTIKIKKEQVNANETSESEMSASTLVASGCMKDSTEVHSLLKCAQITVYNPLDSKKKKKCTLGFLDDGSHKSYAKDSLIKELGLETLKTTNIEITGIGGKKLGQFRTGVFELGLKGKELDMLIKVRSINSVMPKLPYIKYEEKILNKLKMNKIKFKPTMEEPEILIGGDYYNHLGITPVTELPNGFWISSSKLGPIISGEGKIEHFNEIKYAERNQTLQYHEIEYKEEAITGCVMDQTFEFDFNENSGKVSDANLDKLIERQNLLENIGLSDLISNDDEKWLKDFEDKLYFNGERYEVKLSWNDEVHALPDNYGLAIGRLRSTMKKLKENPALMKQYNEIFEDQLKKGIIEIAPKKRSQVTHYLPHHFVERQDKVFTKIRIVFDASAKLRKEYPSLNECLNKGPKLYNDLTGILIRSRLKKYLMTCDVEKAFLQIGIAPEDRDALRFLWFTDPNDQRTLTEFRFCRVTFGVICSPAHLQVVLNNHFKLYEGDIVRNLESDSYVDNISIEMERAEDTKRNYKYLKKIFKEANMNVREFTSNAWQEILELPEEDRTEGEMTKLLGLHWNVRKDTLAVKFPYFDMDKPITRRSILSQIHKPYDPTGLTGPIVLKGKLIMQKVEKDKKLKWDTVINNELVIEWRKLMTLWNDQMVEFPRLCAEIPKDKAKRYELHAFSDASIEGLGIAIYLRIVGKNDEISCNLIYAKSLVIPTQLERIDRSIPSLELHAARLAVNNIGFVKKEVEKTIPINVIRIWTDSTDVVDYLKTYKEKNRFINNRVKVLRKFRVTHIPGKENPADLASRGCTPSELIDNPLWFKGPDWIHLEEAKWPESIRDFDPKTYIPVEKAGMQLEMSMANITQNEPLVFPLFNYENFSQLRRLKNATAYLIRAIEFFKRKGKSKPDKPIELNLAFSEMTPLKVDELKEAENLLILEAQAMFPPSNDTIISLGLFQENQIWKAGGRIQKSKIELSSIHPIFIAKQAPITDLIIKEEHLLRKHAGVTNLTAAIRTKYWIPSCRQKIIQVIKKNKKTLCGFCARFQVKAYLYPDEPPLPEYRVSGEMAWETVGIDYFGPLAVKSTCGKDKHKVWGAIFACARTRMIHLEIVTDASAAKFVLAFTRFIRRWRVPKRIISDNGSNFILGEKAIKAMAEENAKLRASWDGIYTSKEVKEFVTQNQIEWFFNSPCAPWRGGQYERLIGIVKYHMKREIRNKLLSFEELWTTLIEIERIINERPLSFLSENEVIRPLRPIDLVSPSLSMDGPDVSSETFDPNDPDYVEIRSRKDKLLESYKNAQLIANQFWNEWKTSYLLGLRERHFGCLKRGEKFPKIGDVVIVADQNAPRSAWKLGKIEDFVSSRTAQVKIGNKLFERAIKNLYPLEFDSESEIQTRGTDQGNSEEDENPFADNYNNSISGVTMVEEGVTLYTNDMPSDEMESLPEKLTEDERIMLKTTKYDGKISVAAPVLFLGNDIRIIRLTKLFQINFMRCLLLVKSLEAADWWDSLFQRMDIRRQVKAFVIWTHDDINNKAAQFIESLLTATRHIKVFWIGSNIYFPDATCISVPLNLDLELIHDQLVDEGIPYDRQNKDSALDKFIDEAKSKTSKRKWNEIKSNSEQAGPSSMMKQPTFGQRSVINAVFSQESYTLQQGPSFVDGPYNEPSFVDGLSNNPSFVDGLRDNPSFVDGLRTTSPTAPPVYPMEEQNEQPAFRVFPAIPVDYPNFEPDCIIVDCGRFGEALGFFTKKFHLSNFNEETRFTINNQLYTSSEQWYCQQKALFANRSTLAYEIVNFNWTPAQIKEECKAHKIGLDQYQWSRIKYGIMKEGLVAKFRNEPARTTLLKTGNAHIFEMSSDSDWGIGCDHREIFERRPHLDLDRLRGQNNLGRILMEIREEMQQQPQGQGKLAFAPINDQLQKNVNTEPAFEPNDSACAHFFENLQINNPALDKNRLTALIFDKYEQEKEDEEELRKKAEIVEEIDRALNSWKSVSAFPFGSSLSGLGRKGSDLDVVVVFTFEVNLEPVALLNAMNGILCRRMTIDERPLVIRSKKCPILMIKYKGKAIDISIGNSNQLEQIFNGIWLRTLININPLFPVICNVIRSFADRFVDPKHQGLNSFSLVLLVQTYLTKLGLLPNLFERYPSIYGQVMIEDYLNVEKHLRLAQGLKGEFTTTKPVLDTLCGFLKWLQTTEFHTSKVLPREGKVAPRTERFENMTVLIVTPFKREGNAASCIGPECWQKFLTHVNATIDHIQECNWTELGKALGVIGMDNAEYIRKMKGKAQLLVPVHDKIHPMAFEPEAPSNGKGSSSSFEMITTSSTSTFESRMEATSSFAMNENRSIQPARTTSPMEYSKPLTLSDEEEWIDAGLLPPRKGKKQSKFKRTKGMYKRRIWTNSSLHVSSILLLYSLSLCCSVIMGSQPMVCHFNSESKFVKISHNHNSCLNFGQLFDHEPTNFSLTLYKPNQIDYTFSGFECSIIRHEMTYWKNWFNDPFEIPNQEILSVSKEDCEEMAKRHKCREGFLFGDPEGTMTTGKKLAYELSYWSIGKKRAVATNCILKNLTLISRPGSEEVTSPFDNLAQCRYSDGYCRIRDESIIVWKTEKGQGTEALTSDYRRCIFKRFEKRNGIFYRSGWLSNPPDMSLTFAENPERITSCNNQLVISQQGFAIEHDEYETMINLIKKRSKREAQEPFDGQVRVSQLETQLQARAMFADRELRNSLQAYTKFVCDYISDSLFGHDFSHINPTLLIRELANSPILAGSWATGNILEYWSCSFVYKYQIVPADTCFDRLLVNVTLFENSEPFETYLDPKTMILHNEAKTVPCLEHQHKAIFVDGKLFQVNQLTGTKELVKNISELNTQNKAWNHNLPETNLQIFQKLIITNLTEGQLDMMTLFKSYRTSQFSLKTGKGPASSGGGSSDVLSDENFSIWGTLWSKFDGWVFVTRITVSGIIIQWCYLVYTKVMEVRIRRIIKKERKREAIGEIQKLEALKLGGNPINPKIQAINEEDDIVTDSLPDAFVRSDVRRTIKRGRNRY